MSAIALERPQLAPLTNNGVSSSPRSRPFGEATAMEDPIGSGILTGEAAVEASTSSEKETKKKSGFNLKKTAKTVMSGINRKKKISSEEKSKSHEDLRLETGDQPVRDKRTPFNRMMNNLHNPENKLNKMWNSLNKTFSGSQNQPQFPELTGTRSTMTLGRFFGKKRDQLQELPPVKEGRKAHTLGRMLNFARPSERKSGETNASAQPETTP